jgi:fumarylacetoacetase
MRELKSWLEITKSHDFSIYNIPFGVFYTNQNQNTARCGAALGDYIIDLNELMRYGYFKEIKELHNEIFNQNALNEFFSLGNSVCNSVREKIQNLFLVENNSLKSHPDHIEKILVPSHSAKMMLPIKVKDYVDFYSSLDHAVNVGKMFRDEKNPLLPNWKHIPIGYHGRSSSIVVSGTNFKRPKGQLCAPDSNEPIYSYSKQMDFELEMAFITNKNTALGEVLTPDNAKNSIFGLTLFNDWSARDIQRWEYVPLGPFLGKSFASSMSPWVVSLEALAPFALAAPEKDTPELDYLKCSTKAHYDICLDVYIQTEKMKEPFLISQSNYKYMYWNLLQQLAHMTSNGTPISVGDVYGSGTISGPTANSYGSMLELSWKGTKPISLPDGTNRSFLQDGDSIIFNGYAIKDNIRVGFGNLTGIILSN